MAQQVQIYLGLSMTQGQQSVQIWPAQLMTFSQQGVAYQAGAQGATTAGSAFGLTAGGYYFFYNTTTPALPTVFTVYADAGYAMPVATLGPGDVALFRGAVNDLYYKSDVNTGYLQVVGLQP